MPKLPTKHMVAHLRHSIYKTCRDKDPSDFVKCMNEEGYEEDLCKALFTETSGKVTPESEMHDNVLSSLLNLWPRRQQYPFSNEILGFIALIAIVGLVYLLFKGTIDNQVLSL